MTNLFEIAKRYGFSGKIAHQYCGFAEIHLTDKDRWCFIRVSLYCDDPYAYIGVRKVTPYDPEGKFPKLVAKVNKISAKADDLVKALHSVDNLYKTI